MVHKKKSQLSLFFIGHFAIDTVIRFEKENNPTLGGSVSYCSLALNKYTNNVKISIISNIGKKNFESKHLELLNNSAIDLDGVKWSDAENTHFILKYQNHERTLFLKSCSPKLDFNDIPENYLKTPPHGIVLVPLCNELDIQYVEHIVENFPETYIGIDLQGFIREIDENGNVSLAKKEETIIKINKIISIIGNKLILKGSEEEMKLLSGKQDLNEVMEYFNNVQYKGISIMTLGDKGSMITQRGKKMLIIPAFKPDKVVDETGAGDVYLSIFMYEYLTSNKSWEKIAEAGYLASAAASFVVEKIGTQGVKKKEKVLERLNSKKYIKN
ncbi:MAG: hypothetical protein EU521_01490 [Promethearchaeota archaeon]|nr:MAG: hypothetical protein EU521_01490 [Candidatus Lokiarchaeota archaeon]